MFSIIIMQKCLLKDIRMDFLQFFDEEVRSFKKRGDLPLLFIIFLAIRRRI